MIEDLRTSHEWKIQLTIKINLVSTTGLTEKRLMHSESDNAEIMTDLDYYMELCQSIMMTATAWIESKQTQISKKESMKIPFVIYANTMSLLEKTYTWDNVRIVPKNLFTLQKSKHIACDYSLFTHCSFNSKQTWAKYDFYRK